MPLSPMMQHYMNIKEKYPDTIVFYRLGDFYEMFFDDAKTVSRELELTLTGRDCGLTERAPMCGIPFHAVDSYLPKLIEKGYKVAICEQLIDPKDAKGLVDRDVIRVVTPGTIIEPNMLEDGKPNYILSIILQKNHAGMAFCDVSTGEFYVYQLDDVRARLGDELARIAPSEIITPDLSAFRTEQSEWGRQASNPGENRFVYATASKALTKHFHKSMDEMGFSGMKLAVSAAGGLLSYLQDTQKNALCHIAEARSYVDQRFMIVDKVAARNLELTETLRGKGKKGTLLGVLDRTCTSMGSRCMRSWIERPLYDMQAIRQRLDAVEELVNAPMDADELRACLRNASDVERLQSRVAYDAVNARDCLALRNTLTQIPNLLSLGKAFTSQCLKDVFSGLDPMSELTNKLRIMIHPEAPLSVRDGGIILKGYNAELDELRDISIHGKEYLQQLEERERARTGIKTLKVGYNRVFGYYLEVTKSFYDQIPFDYVRKQTLANAERFITEELKELEGKILGAEENAVKLEYELFVALREELKTLLPRLESTSKALKQLDALLALAQAARENGYVRPEINDEGRMEIRQGRHPVVEESIGREAFVPNDTTIDNEHRLMMITGPNMAGKSTYMRQTALIVLMAHIGSFVPALRADIALTDRIFTRIGASDDLYGGQSTFMVEMTELASILQYATPNSLLILDEVGRGTSTFDGLSIAWAAVEYIVSNKCGAKALFSTHYHELSELEGKLESVHNYRITAKEQGEDVIFLRKIIPGGADRSYGVAVARLAGLPRSLISRAQQIMAKLEVDGQQNGSVAKTIMNNRKNGGDKQVSMLDFKPMEFAQEVAALDVVSMTPIEALNKLFELNEKAKRI